VIPSSLLFETNSYAIRDGSHADFRKVITELNTQSPNHDALVGIIRGYADGVGEAEYNQTLSLRRAESVATLLTKMFQDDNWPNVTLAAVGCGQRGDVVGNTHTASPVLATPGRDDPARRTVSITIYGKAKIDAEVGLEAQAKLCEKS